MAVIAPLVSAGIGLLGNRLTQDDQDDRAQQLLQASQGPTSVTSPFGTFRREGDAITLGLTGGQQGDLNSIQGSRANLFGTFQDPEFIQSEVDRLRGIARPREDALRASLRSQLFNRGRLGLGVGGGTTGVMFNPELAALEEGLARADASRVDQARQEQTRQLGMIGGLFGLENNLNSQVARTAGIASAFRPSNAGLSGIASANQRAGDFNDAFFSTLGNAVSGFAFGGLGTGAVATAPGGQNIGGAGGLLGTLRSIF
jgi:hypothetical protein